MPSSLALSAAAVQLLGSIRYGQGSGRSPPKWIKQPWRLRIDADDIRRMTPIHAHDGWTPPVPTTREAALIMLIDSHRNPVHGLWFDGEADHVVVPLSLVIRESLLRQCRSIELHHNHVSGDPRPSSADIRTTRMLCRALRPHGIRLSDHVIHAHRHRFSFRTNGLL